MLLISEIHDLFSCVYRYVYVIRLCTYRVGLICFAILCGPYMLRHKRARPILRHEVFRPCSFPTSALEAQPRVTAPRAGLTINWQIVVEGLLQPPQAPKQRPGDRGENNSARVAVMSAEPPARQHAPSDRGGNDATRVAAMSAEPQARQQSTHMHVIVTCHADSRG